MDTTLLTTAGLGFVLGLRHALDPDHLVAVSTLVSERGGGPRASLVGGFWASATRSRCWRVARWCWP